VIKFGSCSSLSNFLSNNLKFVTSRGIIFVRRGYHEGNSVASYCHKLAAALVPDMFCNFYLMKSHKIANNSATTKAREK